MARAFFVFFVIYTVVAGLVFTYRSIKQRDIKVAGKLLFAGLLSLIITAFTYIVELS